MSAVLIWTTTDRLCHRCRNQRAEVDDWLCRGCRTSLEAEWTRLTRDPRLQEQNTTKHPRDFLG